jgi:prepilin-type N-terminal cleavage/methylation domain-containing protein
MKIPQSLRNNKITNKGFTLLEVLLVVGIVSILAGIVLLAINPSRNLSDTRNAQRRLDVNTINSAVYQYAIANGTVPASITVTPTAACASGGVCTGLVDLTVLTALGRYLVAIPKDPTTGTANSTGYNISRDANGRIVVSAPGAEVGAVISVTR